MQLIDGIGEQFDMVTLREYAPSISFWKHQVIEGVRPNEKLLQSENDIIFHRNFSKLKVRDNVLIREVKSEDLR